MMPSGHKAFVVSNTNDVELLLMHNRTHAAEYVFSPFSAPNPRTRAPWGLCWRGQPPANKRQNRIAHNVSARKRVDIIARAKQLGVKVTNPKAKVTTEV